MPVKFLIRSKLSRVVSLSLEIKQYRLDFATQLTEICKKENSNLVHTQFLRVPGQSDNSLVHINDERDAMCNNVSDDGDGDEDDGDGDGGDGDNIPSLLGVRHLIL